MKEFVAIDFETANSQRVSACALGYAKILDCNIVESKSFLIKPIGGHAPFQSKIHGITEAHTFDKPYFKELYPEIREIFDYPLVAHSLFDKQVLNALSDHFRLNLKFDYVDSCSIAKTKLPKLNDCKLKTLVSYFGLPAFKHHDAKEDAVACAKVFLILQNQGTKTKPKISSDEYSEMKGMVMGVLADEEVNYKEAYELLYWLEDHVEACQQHQNLYCSLRNVLEDGHLNCVEAAQLKLLLENTLREMGKKE